MKYSKEYSVKYLGIVEGNVGVLTRKMPLPVFGPDRQLSGVALNSLKEYRALGAKIKTPILQNKYQSAK